MIRRWLVLFAISWPCFAHAQLPVADAVFASTFDNLAGQPQVLSQWKGKPLIINFWARWCPPCRTEIPDFVKVNQEYRAAGLNVIGIALEDEAEPVREFANAYEIDYTLLVGKEKGMALMRALGNSKMGLPFTVAIDRAGRLVVVKTGAIRHSELVTAAGSILR